MRYITPFFAILMSATFALAADAPATSPLPAKNKVHVYLLIGQSNMCGRAPMTDADRVPTPRVFSQTREHGWIPAAHPLFSDKPTAGVGLAIDFAKTMLKDETDPEVVIALVPAAVGGTPLARWVKGADLYEAAVVRAKAAMKDGTLKGVLWHQGEGDSQKAVNADSYAARLDKMIADLRADLESPDVPFVVGELGHFLHDPRVFYTTVNQALVDLPKRVPNTACTSSKDLTHKGDDLHFNAESLRVFGTRYAAEMKRLQSSQAKK